MRYFFLLFFFLTACSPETEGDFHAEGKKVALELICILKEVKTKEDLEKRESKIRKEYLLLADLIKKVKVHKSSLLEPLPFLQEEAILQREIKRIYFIPGGKEIFERAQEDALSLLYTESSSRIGK